MLIKNTCLTREHWPIKVRVTDAVQLLGEHLLTARLTWGIWLKVKPG